MNAAITVEALVKRYGRRTIVDGVDLNVAHGRLLALVGRNGAGKTTTVECVEGFRRPDRGTVRVLGCDPARQRHRIADRIGVMLQDGGAYPAATPREMLRLYARLYRRARDVDEVLAVVGLSGVAEARFRTLSGGEQQRVNLALALVGSPEVLFLDEPTAGMDPAMRRATWELVSTLRRDGTAILLTTHHLDEAEHLADTVAILHDGTIAASGSPSALVGSTEELLITAEGPLDVASLGAALGATVRRVAPGRYAAAVGPEAIPSVSAWFAGQDTTLTGITTARRTLEDVFLSLTGSDT